MRFAVNGPNRTLPLQPVKRVLPATFTCAFWALLHPCIRTRSQYVYEPRPSRIGSTLKLALGAFGPATAPVRWADQCLEKRQSATTFRESRPVIVIVPVARPPLI